MLLVDMNGIQPSPVWWRTWIANQTVWIANQTAEIYAQRHTAAIEHWPWGDESQPLRDLRRDPHGEGKVPALRATAARGRKAHGKATLHHALSSQSAGRRRGGSGTQLAGCRAARGTAGGASGLGGERSGSRS